MPTLLAAFLFLGLLAPCAQAEVCETRFLNPEQMTQALMTADHLSPSVRRALFAANRSLSARSRETWLKFSEEITPYLYPSDDLATAFSHSVKRLETQPGLGAFLFKTVQTKWIEGGHTGALLDIGAGLVCVSFSSLKENLTYVDRYVDASIAWLHHESDRTEWEATFARLAAQITHYR